MLRTRIAALTIALAATLTSSAAAQGTLGLEAGYKGYSFKPGLGAKAAELFIVPVAVRVPITNTVQADVYGAWARGQVERDGVKYRLAGPVDTQLKASWAARPWAIVSLALSVPTGKETHSNNEAVVAAVLASDLLGFRESTWGTGMAVTTGIATARRVGQWGLGVGASYRLASGFDPSSEQDLTYEPGSEMRIRVGADRNVGETGKVSAGITVQSFAKDQVAEGDADSRNLFRAGDRLMVDGSYAFRVGSQTWTAFASDLWREKGDLFLSLIDGTGTVVGDSTVATGSQNLVVAGVVGAIPIGSSYRLRPSADLHLQTRSEPNGSSEGSGWIFSVGADFPLRILGTYDIFPRARVSTGSLKGVDLKNHGVTGGEIGLTVRWGG
jgi:hypothetical protein